MPWFMFLPLVLYYVGGAAALYVAFRFVRAFERRGVDRAELEAVRARLAQLEEAAAQTAAEVQELEEGASLHHAVARRAPRRPAGRLTWRCS